MSDRKYNENVLEAIEEAATECTSETGVLIGLIDGAIGCFNAIGHYTDKEALKNPDVLEALKDLAANEVLQRLICQGILGYDYEKLLRAYQGNELERLMARAGQSKETER